jgi:2'-5' RNA ligase
MMRLFVAVNFSPSVRDAIASAIDGFPVTDPPWRWSRPETWHLTLKFLGETPEDRVSDITTALERVARAHSSFPMSLDAFGAFPDLKRPRVLFYKVSDGADELRTLAASVDTALETIGFPAEDRPFRAHATLARIKKPLPGAITRKLETIPALADATQSVDSFSLIESHLDPSGARYTVLKPFALGG